MGQSHTLLVSGATGLVGGRWLRCLAPEVTVRALTRHPGRDRLSRSTESIGWDGRELPEDALTGTDAVIHLAGEPIFSGIPTSARRERMYASRVASTESIVASIGRLPVAQRPRVFVCASAVGIYGERAEEELTEDAAPGSGFLAGLCRDWESAARGADSHGVRVVSLRIGLVLAREGGALAGLRHLFRLGLGGPVGHGRQWMPWIHADDLARLLETVRIDPSVSGPVNAVAPEPVRNREFAIALATRMHRPALLRAPAFALRAGLGPLASELLDSRRVVPARAQALGFEWRYPNIASALAKELP